MKTTDLFRFNRSAERINESIEKTFGQRLNLESFDLHKLEDARNKLRTQIHDARSQSGFNENIENEAMTKAQWMLDAINAEIAEREEFIADAGPAEVEEAADSLEGQVAEIIKKFDEDMMEIGGYGDPDQDKIVELLRQGDWDGATEVVWYAYADQDGGELRDMDRYIESIEDEFKDLAQGGDEDEGGETDDNYALASAGFGSDEDYESVQYEDQVSEKAVSKAQQQAAGIALAARRKGETPSGKGAAAEMSKMSMKELEKFAGTKHKNLPAKKDESINTTEAYINSAKDAIDILADIRKQSKMAELGQGDPVRPNQLVNDLWDVMQWIEANMEESIETESSDFVKGVKRLIKGKKNPSDVRDAHLAKATFGDESDKDKEEKRYDKVQKLISKESKQGESMSNLREGEVQQASAIVTAKTMVDRVSRWIEELSSMENDTLLQLGDSIRDEMGQEQAKGFISSVAPAIQQALENLKSTRETMATGVRQLTGEEQGAEMLGAEPGADIGGEEEMGPVEPDAMNAGGEELGGDDEFAAAEPAAGMGDAGREQRESIDRSSNLLRVLAG